MRGTRETPPPTCAPGSGEWNHPPDAPTCMEHQLEAVWYRGIPGPLCCPQGRFLLRWSPDGGWSG
uniref:Uncharacterized protein n=1 Tax=Phocoena sinus TaxID=42100 RepID=A0A8C9BN51_PHOSS